MFKKFVESAVSIVILLVGGREALKSVDIDMASLSAIAGNVGGVKLPGVTVTSITISPLYVTVVVVAVVLVLSGYVMYTARGMGEEKEVKQERGGGDQRPRSNHVTPMRGE